VYNCEVQDNPSKPFTPTVCGLVLPAPTSQGTRRARAASFSAWVAAPLEASDEKVARTQDTLESEPVHGPFPQRTLPEHGESSVEKTVRFLESPSQRPCELGQCRLSEDDAIQGNNTLDPDEEDADSQQDFGEVRDFADSIDFDNSQLISFEMLTPPSGLRGGNVEICTLRPVRTVQIREESPLSIKHQQRISQSTSCQVTNLTAAPWSPQPSDSFSSSDKSWSMVLPKTAFKTGTGHTSGTSRETGSPQPPPSSPINADSSGPQSSVISRRTVANRHARLIDGAIFTGKHRGPTDPSHRQGDNLYDGEAKGLVVRAAVRQKDSSRHSLIQGVRGIFRKDQQSQQQQRHVSDHKKGHRRTSSLLHNALDRGCDMLSPRPTIANTSPDSAITPHVYTHSWGLDGTFDEVTVLPRSNLNLNKTLPASPGMSGARKASSSRTATPSPKNPGGTPIRPSTSSSVSSGISIASNKQDFRNLTRGLIIEDMSAHRPDLSPVREAEILSPRKYDPRESMPTSVYS
jgi:hypothetical protein